MWWWKQRQGRPDCILCQTVFGQALRVRRNQPYQWDRLFRLYYVGVCTFWDFPAPQFGCPGQLRTGCQLCGGPAGRYHLLFRSCGNLCGRRTDCSCQHAQYRHHYQFGHYADNSDCAQVLLGNRKIQIRKYIQTGLRIYRADLFFSFWLLTKTSSCDIKIKYVWQRGLVKWHDRGLQNP